MGAVAGIAPPGRASEGAEAVAFEGGAAIPPAVVAGLPPEADAAVSLGAPTVPPGVEGAVLEEAEVEGAPEEVAGEVGEPEEG